MSECSNLDVTDLEREELRVRRGKGGKDRIVPLGRKAREAMQLQVKIARAVPGYDRGRPTKKDRRDLERARRPDRD